MGALKSAVRAFEDDEVQELAMGAIEVLPGVLQTRADIDMEAVDDYSRAMMRGGYHLFPPLLVYRLPDGRLVLVDGFHRWKAREKQCKGLRCAWTVRAVVRGGTMEEAILAGLKANQEAKNALKLRKEDIEHTLRMMVRDPELRTWSDKELASRAGVSKHHLRGVRICLRDREGIPIPDKVKIFKNGTPTGRFAPYKLQKGGLPAITESSDGSRTCQWQNQKYKLPRDPAKAEAAVRKLVEGRDSSRPSLKANDSFKQWLIVRNINAKTIDTKESLFGGVEVGGSFLFPVAEISHEAILREIGRACLVAKEISRVSRLILVGYREFVGLPRVVRAIHLSGMMSPPIEFMTPEQVVAEFGPEAEGATQP